jgi:hypothetical protein
MTTQPKPGPRLLAALAVTALLSACNPIGSTVGAATGLATGVVTTTASTAVGLAL